MNQPGWQQTTTPSKTGCFWGFQNPNLQKLFGRLKKTIHLEAEPPNMHVNQNLWGLWRVLDRVFIFC